MGETLYTVLGVGRDADSDAIQRAYRNNAKTHHPDVSDDPCARERFKRMTFARDTLTDESERARYERLGHEAYVRKHAPQGLFEAGGGSEPEAGPATDGRARTAATDGGAAAAAGWWDERSGTDTAGPTPAGGTASTSTAASKGADGPSTSRATTTSGADFYSTDPDVKADPTTTAGPVTRVWNVARALGVWLAVHVVLFASALGVGLVAISRSVAADLALPGLLFLFALAASALLASALHIVSVLYT